MNGSRIMQGAEAHHRCKTKGYKVVILAFSVWLGLATAVAKAGSGISTEAACHTAVEVRVYLSRW